jgi:anthranilate synthase component I
VLHALSFDAFASAVASRRADSPRARLAVPVYRFRSADLLTPVAAFLSIREPGGFGFLLESVEGGERLGRYSFIGRRPYLVIEAYGEDTFIRQPGLTVSGDGAAHERTDGNAFEVLQSALDAVEEIKLPELPRFTGGAVGLFGYDAARLLERLPHPPEDDLGTPDALWALYDTVAAFDHVTQRIVMMATVFVDPDTDLQKGFAHAQNRLDEMEAELAAGPVLPPSAIAISDDGLSSNVEREDFERAVLAAKAYIREGDIFQVVLSQRFSVQFDGDPFTLYRSLRQVNPSPYLFFLEFDQIDGQPLVLAGSSPEVLVRVEGNRAQVLPIAGTRPRGETAAEDALLASGLLEDPKERAEHLMLVDLGRNDLGRTCVPGSVRVDRYADVQRFARVMHLVSSVSGEVDAASRGLDVLAACFPAGTVSGAPKVRAMEIIDELEPTRRGVYAGAVGYVDFSGNTDTCITIRTMLIRPDTPAAVSGTAYVQAGAGVVADSSPAGEYDETFNKARALFDAIRNAASGLL